MKKHLLISTMFAAFLMICASACQKESQVTASNNEAANNGLATDRDLEPFDPCGNRQTVHYLGLATKRPINTSAFTTGWKWGELDRIANDCILGNTIFPNCEAGGMAVFFGIPQFSVFNFTDANGYVTPQQQNNIINQALAYASSHITTCGEGTSPRIYQIDFTRFPSGPFSGEEYQFAVRYQCCPTGVTDDE